jgi:hypothetical protein
MTLQTKLIPIVILIALASVEIAFRIYKNQHNNTLAQNDALAQELKNAADAGNVQTVQKIIQNSDEMDKISPWNLGMALAFALSQYDHQKNNKNFMEIINLILQSKRPIDADYLGGALIDAINISHDEMVVEILKNPNAKDIDSSFKIAIFFQSYWGVKDMPGSFLNEALSLTIQKQELNIIKQLLAFEPLYQHASQDLIDQAKALVYQH